MKRFRLLVAAGVASIFLTGFGFGWSPVKLYEGSALPDSQTSALLSGFVAEHADDKWSALLVGVDGVLCKAQVMTGDNSPLPKHACGNISVVSAETHKLMYAIQSINQVSLGNGYAMGENRWKRLDHYIDTGLVTMEPGTIYAARPAFKEGGWTVTVEAVCKSSNFKKGGQWWTSRQVCR